MVGHTLCLVEGPFTQPIFEVHYPLAECVRRGAEFLDSKYPGWAAQVNNQSLDMQDERNCVLGQLYGEAFSAIHTFHKDWQWMLENGFIMHPDDFSLPRYAALTDHWRNAVKSRTAA